MPARSVTPPSAGERIRAALAMAKSGPAFARPGGPARICALGWATVELDRAAFELAAELGFAAGAFVPADDSLALGARCRVARGAISGDVALVILEPATEGRLAAMLARFGEGPVAIWFVPDDAAATPGRLVTSGPFGRERTVPGGPVDGPRWFLIGPGAGTIPQ